MGYEIEHKYSRTSYPAMQNYYHLTQIAHMINQFVDNAKEIIELEFDSMNKIYEAIYYGTKKPRAKILYNSS